MKYKYFSQIFISADFFTNNYCIDTRYLKVNLELINKFRNNNENFRKNKLNPEEPICKLLELKNNYKILKGVDTYCKKKFIYASRIHNSDALPTSCSNTLLSSFLNLFLKHAFQIRFYFLFFQRLHVDSSLPKNWYVYIYGCTMRMNCCVRQNFNFLLIFNLFSFHSQCHSDCLVL